MSYMVLDDFCPDVDRVAASAHAAGFDTWRPNKGQVGSSVYEGMGYVGDHVLMLRSLALAVGPVLPNSMFFRVTNVGMEQAYIHSDRESGNHTCIAYLSEHEETSGTAFYRHKPTGLLSMPSFAEMTASGQFEALRDDMVSRDPDKWEQVDFVRGRKNRALIFPAPMFHSRFPLDGIGNNTEDGRLIWATHFYKLAPNGELH